MPFSYAQYAGNGSTTTFSVPFPYLLKAHVKLYTGYSVITGTFATQLTEGTDFTWTSGTQVQVTVAPANGTTLTVKRETPTSALAVPWQDGSNLIGDDLTASDLQNLYVVQEQQDRTDAIAVQQLQASADAAAALAGVNNALPYGPVGTVAAIPASAANGTRIEVANSTGIESFSPLTGKPAGFTGSAQIKVRLVYTTSGSTWQWVDYAVGDPDGRYVRQSNISGSTTSTSTTTVANSLAVKTAADAADAAQSTANTAATNAAAAQSTANTAVSNAAAAQSTANAAVPSAVGPLAGFRNLLINGNPIINQREYASGTATTGANQYTLDRWRVVTSGQSITWTDSANVRTITAPAGGIEQVIEGINILSGTYVLNWTGTATATVNGTSVAKGGTVTLTGGTNCTVRFSGGTFSLPQLEPGTVATPFERRSFGQELALCQRYFERQGEETYLGFPAPNATFAHTFPLMFKAQKRIAPTIVYNLNNTFNVSNSAVISSTTYAWSLQVVAASATNTFASTNFTASAEL